MKNIYYTYCYYFLCFWFYSLFSISQQDNIYTLVEKDTLAKYSFEQLSMRIDNDSVSIQSALSYNQYLIKRYKNKKDTLALMNSYIKMLSLQVKNELKLISYNDSLNFLAKTKKQKEIYLESLYGLSFVFFNEKKYNKSLKYSILTNNLAKKLENKDIYIASNHYIANIRDLNEDYEKGLEIRLENKRLIKDQRTSEYQANLYGIAYELNQLNKLDSAFYYSIQGLDLARIHKVYPEYYFLLNLGEIEFKNKNFLKAKNYLDQAEIDLIKNNDIRNLSEAYYYLGQVQKALEPKSFAYLNYFKAIDSIFNINNDLFPKMRKGYHFLINHYQKIEIEKAIYYSKQLNKYDSLINIRQKKLGESLYEKYEIPRIISKEKEMIYDLKDKQDGFQIIILFFASMSIIIFFFYQRQRNKTSMYKNNAKELLRSNLNINNISNKNNSIKKIAISSEIHIEILKKLDQFENNKEFTNSKITLISLSKKFNTNPKYLSQIINKQKGRNFKNYLNKLRIDYTVQELKENPVYMKYTIQAIAEEFGFNTAESFSNAFVKFSGTKPSYFIKELKEKSMNKSNFKKFV